MALQPEPTQARFGEWVEALERDGWVRLPKIDPQDMRVLLRKIGCPRAVERLSTRGRATRGIRSLSGIHGLGAFPFHTDGAARPTPPTYVALWSPRAYDTATLLVDGASLRLAHPVFSRCWLVTPGAEAPSFYAVPRLQRRGVVTWRLNPDCMRPASTQLSPLDVSEIFASVGWVRMEWRAADALILDNRRVLHAREPVSRSDAVRELLRVQVYRDMVC